MSIVANLQAHQLVLTKELNEINNDLVALQQMGFRYEVQCGISFRPAVDHLVVLRAQKEQLLSQVNSQLAMVQDSVASSTQLVNQMNAMASSFTSAVPKGLLPSQQYIASTPAPSTFQLPHPARSPVASSAVHVTNADIVSSSLYGSEVVHIQGPSGLIVSTNSSILAHSPQRDRM